MPWHQLNSEPADAYYLSWQPAPKRTVMGSSLAAGNAPSAGMDAHLDVSTSRTLARPIPPNLTFPATDPAWSQRLPHRAAVVYRVRLTAFWRHPWPSAIANRSRRGSLRRRKAPPHPARLPCPPGKCHSMCSTRRPVSRSGIHAPHETNVPRAVGRELSSRQSWQAYSHSQMLPPFRKNSPNAR